MQDVGEHSMKTSSGGREYNQLLEQGFCVLKNILNAEMLQRVDEAALRVLGSEDAEYFESQKSTGSLINVHRDPFFAELVTWPKAIATLHSMGFYNPVFSSGYVISKAPHSPPLFWHQDWWGWNDPVSYEPLPQQLFFMYYLVDTTPENGCLRLIPGSHLKRHYLHDASPEAHTKDLALVTDTEHPAFQRADREIDVCVDAGDLVIGDSRILHSAHANRSDQRRTVITLWYLPAFYGLPECMQAYLVRPDLTEGWSESALKRLQPVVPVYSGDAQSIEWNRNPGPALK